MDGATHGVALVKGPNRFHDVTGTLWLELQVTCPLAMSALPLVTGVTLGHEPLRTLTGPRSVHPGDVLTWSDRGNRVRLMLKPLDLEGRDRVLRELGPLDRPIVWPQGAGRLTVLRGPDKGEIRDLRVGLQTVGSSPLATHRVAGLAPFHIALRASPFDAVLVALAPGTRVNDEPRVHETLVDSDRLELGPILLVYKALY
jgi:hypothetical protein